MVIYKKGVYKKRSSFIDRVKDKYCEVGIMRLFKSGFMVAYNKIYNFCFTPYFKYTKGRTFNFNDKKYKYFFHHYNTAYRNERTVEVPVVIDVVKNAVSDGKRILEVGGVLPHYFPVNWDVLDKYEFAEGIINEDVVDFKPQEKYDLIVSISTMEHVGFEEENKDPDKIIKSVNNLKDNCLKKGGKIIITVPLGYNKGMDKQIFTDKIKFDEKYYLKRVSRADEWKQTNFEDIKEAEYGSPFNFANVIIIGVIKK